MTKRILAALLCILFVSAVFSACSSKDYGAVKSGAMPDIHTIPEDNSSFVLSYTQTDSLNPYECKSQNNQILSQLVFESLFDIDENFKASLNLASGYRYTNSKLLEVTIPQGLTFTDGSPITADDVTYSFRKAVKSSYWGSSLSDIVSCNAASSTVIEFRLKYPNNYAHNLLIFPIIAGNSDNSSYPVGNGRYFFADENGKTVLKAVTDAEFTPHFTTIHLENITASDSIDNAVNIGNISFAFRDLSRDSSKKMESNYKPVDINNLVYIGINNKSGIASNAYIRKAVSLAVSREMLVKSAYGGYARAATSLFNPAFELSATEIFSSEANKADAKQAIVQSGVSKLSISLLVNNTNSDRTACAKLVQNQLEDIGFEVKMIFADTYEEYERRILKEQFDLYIGEIKITPDMSFRPFFSADGNAHFGIDTEKSAACEKYENYLNGDAELGAFLLAFSDEMPFIPLLYRQGMICFSKEMHGDVQGTGTDCFKNIENWYFKSE